MSLYQNYNYIVFDLRMIIFHLFLSSTHSFYIFCLKMFSISWILYKLTVFPPDFWTWFSNIIWMSIYCIISIIFRDSMCVLVINIKSFITIYKVLSNLVYPSTVFLIIFKHIAIIFIVRWLFCWRFFWSFCIIFLIPISIYWL